jgi:hypothetical protein
MHTRTFWMQTGYTYGMMKASSGMCSFPSFPSIACCKLEEMLKKAELNWKMSPGDLLLQYSKVYHVRIGYLTPISKVPKEVRDLDSKLGLGLLPTT